MTACGRCGGTVAPDGHCWDCGADQPAFRSHFEVTAPGAAGVSDRGHRRSLNADAMMLTMTGPWTIGVVCDGVSLSPRAERAAQLAADTGAAVLAARLDAGDIPETAHEQAASRAADAVTALAIPDSELSPSTTYVAGVSGPDGIWVAWIGDSRAYWLPDEGPGMALTTDDTAPNEALSSWLGADADTPSPQGRSYRPPSPGSLLLCTDGLWRYLPEPTALRAELDGEDPLPSARALVTYALNAGGHDNVTALIMRGG
ncbi:protein phosphatase 2C domain-containing protein [Spirillospora sp. NPDC047279]|uniref:PP2C family protein-serine/threonine phosphatase n=1 Tax=Spirillospora sp. NPDC047279 TaxID=3155478 RepID=UPI0034057CBF